jgi:hypothetical protein
VIYQYSFHPDYLESIGDFELWKRKVFNEGNNFQGHHLIPKNVMRDNSKLRELLEWAEHNDPDWDFGGLDNGIMLQTRRNNGAGEIVGDHANHKKYDRQIKPHLDEILINSDSRPAEAFNKFKDYVMCLKTLLKNEVADGDFIVNDIDISECR